MKRKATNRSRGRSSNGRKPSPKNGDRRFNLIKQAQEIEGIFREAVEHELSIHKKLGNPIAVWKDGAVVILPPEEIPVSKQ